ncbi:hypothetical protein B5F40_13635 [Gordonibacter sp. An230]|nr:hypothetical protein B5F40_13635 [Gordonibacter sp. An230]
MLGAPCGRRLGAWRTERAMRLGVGAGPSCLGDAEVVARPDRLSWKPPASSRLDGAADGALAAGRAFRRRETKHRTPSWSGFGRLENPWLSYVDCPARTCRLAFDKEYFLGEGASRAWGSIGVGVCAGRRA